MNTLESAAKAWAIKDIPMAHVSTNDNFLTFTESELNNSEHFGQKLPVVINLLGAEDNDHAIKSSMNTVGWATIKGFKNNTLWADAEVTDPKIGEKIERKDSSGRREIGGVSMGARMQKICSICGGDIEEAEHPHKRGQVYDGQLCTAIAKNTKFDHLALTNAFADPQSTLDKSTVNSIEIASKCDFNKLHISKLEVANMPMTGQAPSGVQSPDNFTELLKRIEMLEAQIAELKGAESAQEKPMDEDEKKEEADVGQGKSFPAGDALEAKEGKSQLPTEITIKIDKKDNTEDIKPIAPVAEGSSKLLKKLEGKYKLELASKIAKVSGKEINEYASKSIEELESLVEFANEMNRNKNKISEFSAYKDYSQKVSSGMEEAMKRIDLMGADGALAYAYEKASKGGV